MPALVEVASHAIKGYGSGGAKGEMEWTETESQRKGQRAGRRARAGGVEWVGGWGGGGGLTTENYR